MKIRLLVIVKGRAVSYNRMRTLESSIEEAIRLVEELGGKAGYEQEAFLLAVNFSSSEVAEEFCEKLK